MQHKVSDKSYEWELKHTVKDFIEANYAYYESRYTEDTMKQVENIDDLIDKYTTEVKAIMIELYTEHIMTWGF